MVAYVRDLTGEIRGEFALDRDVPLINPRWTACVAIHIRRGIVDVVHLRPYSRIQVNRENVIRGVRQARAKNIRGLPEGCRIEAEGVPAYADRRGAGAIRCVAVRNAPTGSHHHLGSKLVSDAQPRANGIRIRGGEAAIALARAPTFINRCAEQTAGGRVRKGRCEHAATVECFLRRRLAVPADAVVECQFAGDLPSVLQVDRHGGLAVVGILCGGDAGVIHHAQQITGVGESDRITPYTGSLEVRKSRLIGAEAVSGSRDGVLIDRRVQSPLQTDLVGMVTAHIGDVQVQSRLVGKVHDRGAHAHAVRRAEPAHEFPRELIVGKPGV